MRVLLSLACLMPLTCWAAEGAAHQHGSEVHSPVYITAQHMRPAKPEGGPAKQATPMPADGRISCVVGMACGNESAEAKKKMTTDEKRALRQQVQDVERELHGNRQKSPR